MQATTLVPIDEYLHTSYEPDCDYVDGVLEERNLGEYNHARLQGLILAYLFAQEAGNGTRVVPEQRIRTTHSRFRVPDVVVIEGRPAEQVLTAAPLLCIEVLSPEDRLTRVSARSEEYISMGAPEIWTIDPDRLRTYKYTSKGLHETSERILTTADGRVRLDLDAIEQDLRH